MSDHFQAPIRSFVVEMKMSVKLMRLVKRNFAMPENERVNVFAYLFRLDFFFNLMDK